VAVLRAQGAGHRAQGTGHREQGTGRREQGATSSKFPSWEGPGVGFKRVEGRMVEGEMGREGERVKRRNTTRQIGFPSNEHPAPSTQHHRTPNAAHQYKILT